MDEPIKPLRFDPPPSIDPKLLAEVFDPSGYFAVGYFKPPFMAEGRRTESMGRDRLKICPIPKKLLMRAVQSGRLKGMIVEQPGDIRVVVTDSPKGIRSFLLAYAYSDDSARSRCTFATYGFQGVRRLKWHRPVKDDRIWGR